MKILFWLSFAVLSYTYVGYPLYIWARSKVAPRPWQRASILPNISVIMAVHNGATGIREKLDHLLTLDYPPELSEVVVVSDGSSDGTNEILARVSHPRLQVIICSEHRGKAAAINAGLEHSRGDIVVFTDLRQRLEGSSTRNLISNFADPTVGCATGQLCLDLRNSDDLTQSVGGLYWRYEQNIRRCEGLVDSVLGVSGAFYAIRRELAAPLPCGLILDDMYQPLSAVRQGYRAVLDVRARFWDVMPTSARGEFQRKVRTLTGNYQLLRLAPWVLTRENRLRFELISHKMLRLLAPVLLLTILATSVVLRSEYPYRIFFGANIAIVLLAITGLLNVPILRPVSAPIAAFCLLNAAAIVALGRFLSSKGTNWISWSGSGTGGR